MKVFIADDSKVLRDHLSEMLSDIEGIEIIGEAINTSDAIQNISKKLPDIAIVDIKMPGKGGLHVLERIKHSHPDVTTIIFTNYPYHQYREKAYESGADYFFDKSGEMDKMLATLKLLRDREKQY